LFSRFRQVHAIMFGYFQFLVNIQITPALGFTVQFIPIEVICNPLQRIITRQADLNRQALIFIIEINSE